MFKNFWKNITKSLVIWIFIWLWILISYATNITSISQTIITWDIITKDWFNVVNTNLNNINSSITNISNKLVNIFSSWSYVWIWIGVPSTKLDVAWNIKWTGLCIWSDCKTSWLDTWKWSLNWSDIYYNSGSMWVWTNAPTEKLEVTWNIKWTGLCLWSDCKTSWPNSSQWNSNWSNIYYSDGNVWVWTNTPESKLHVDSWSIIISNSLWSPRLKLVNTSLWSVTTAPSWEIDNSSDTFRIFRQPNISTAWSAYLIINNSWSIGIWTETPTRKLHVAWDIYANWGWLRSSWNAWWYSETYGGGWYMSDTTWLRTYNSKNVWTNTWTLWSNWWLTVWYGWAVPPAWWGIVAGALWIWTSSPRAQFDVRWTISQLQWGTRDIRIEWWDWISRNLAILWARNDSTDMLFLNYNWEYAWWTRIWWTTTIYSAWIYQPIHASAFNISSDKRLKTNIKPLKNSKDILQVSAKKFDWINKKQWSWDIWVIAQDIEKYFPEFVSEDSDWYKTVDYSKLVVPLIDVVKEQEKKLNELEKRLKLLESK